MAALAAPRPAAPFSSEHPNQLRFGVGDRVQCNVGEWVTGTVVAHFYRERHWPQGRTAPYQIRLDDGGAMIFAPLDDDRVVKALPRTPVHDCLKRKDMEALAALCDGALPPRLFNLPDADLSPPLCFLFSAPETQDWSADEIAEAARLLVEEGGARVNGLCDGRGSSPLHLAAARDDVDVLNVALKWCTREHGLDINAQNLEQSKYTGGDWHKVTGDKRYMDREEKDAQSSEPTILHDTALHLAVKEECEESAIRLIECGADVNIPDHEGDTPLVSALDNDLLDVAQMLLGRGAAVDVASPNLACNSLLHHFASRGNVAVLTMLMDAETFDAGLLERPGGALDFTPLHLAARGGRTQACELLLARGASAAARDKNGKTPADLAEANKKAALAAKLRAL